MLESTPPLADAGTGTGRVEPIPLDRALVVEDEVPDRARMRGLLEATVGENLTVTVARTLREARAAANAAAFDVALVAIGLPDGTGIELIGWLHAWHPRVASLVLTSRRDGDTVLAALRAGAIGYLLKDRDDEDLLRALQHFRQGGAPIDPFVTRRMLAVLPAAVPRQRHRVATREDLSGREQQILDLVARGRNNREIAALVGLSRFTVEDYTKRIYRKLAVGSRAAAVFEAQVRGLLH